MNERKPRRYFHRNRDTIVPVQQTATPYGAAPKHRSEKRPSMTIGFAHLSPTLSIIFGVLILIMPRFLNYFVAIYLILAGLLGLGAIR